MNNLVSEVVIPITIGVGSSLLASIIFLLFVSRVRPHLEISSKIAKRFDPEDNTYIFIIKVLNKGRRSVIAVQAQLHLVTPTQVPGGDILRTVEIPLKRPDPLEISRFDEKDDDANYAFRFTTFTDLDGLWKDEAHSYVKFRIYGRDALSGFGKVFKQDYYTKRNSLKEGDFRKGNSFSIE